MNRIGIALLIAFALPVAHAAELQAKRVDLLCHRTANEDVPENTLESLEQAALLGCDVVEIDLRRTLDGKIVLNHDGVLERLTDGIGDTETTYYDDLRMRDAGDWMGDQFADMRIPLFEDALRLARQKNIQLILDIKDKGIAPDVLQLLRQENMLARVRFGGEWTEVKKLYPGANEGEAQWVQPNVTVEQVKAYHRAGKSVIANFSANDREMDLAGMKAAVTAGVDGINVDYPRLGADAVGRPVERTLARLEMQASGGPPTARVTAILLLSRYRGFGLESDFTLWLLDSDDRISRAAALALVMARPGTSPFAFDEALRSANPHARANAAWALGSLHAPAHLLTPLLHDNDPQVLKETLVALSHAPDEVNAAMLLPLLSHHDPAVRGTAALALARHQPNVAAKAVPAQLKLEIKTVRVVYEQWIERGKPQLTPAEIENVMGYYRCQMKEVQAIAMLHSSDITQALENLAFRPGEDFSQMDAVVAAFQLWSRIGSNPQPAIRALHASDRSVADKAEWMLVQGGPAILPAARAAIDSQDEATRERAIRIVALQGDLGALPRLRALQQTNPRDAELAAWAIEKIEMLHPKL